MNMIQATTASQPAAYQIAVTAAVQRAHRSYFDQHVLSDADQGYITIDEGDYASLPDHLIERIVLTVPGFLIDEY